MWYHDVNGIKLIHLEKNEEGTYLGYAFGTGLDKSPTSPDM
jgi:hypothetical protein